VRSLDDAGRSGLVISLLSSDDGTPQAIDLLLKAGADSNQADLDGNTPLHIAAAMG